MKRLKHWKLNGEDFIYDAPRKRLHHLRYDLLNPDYHVVELTDDEHNALLDWLKHRYR